MPLAVNDGVIDDNMALLSCRMRSEPLRSKEHTLLGARLSLNMYKSYTYARGGMGARIRTHARA